MNQKLSWRFSGLALILEQMSIGDMVLQVSLRVGLFPSFDHGDYCRSLRFSGASEQLSRSRIERALLKSGFRRRSWDFHGNFGNTSSICRCQRTDNVRELFGLGGNGSLLPEITEPGPATLEEGKENRLIANGSSAIREAKENVSLTNGSPLASAVFYKETTTEDEAWELLRAAIVYYCGSPVGTIAANDPTDPNVLNYDQVFIRDFIPSGIAFLLKGEYDIVRNFLLHTLQLQVIFIFSLFVIEDLLMSFTALIGYYYGFLISSNTRNFFT